MKKQILNLGKALNKAEQRNVFGGYVQGECESECSSNSDCGSGGSCETFDQGTSCPETPKINMCI